MKKIITNLDTRTDMKKALDNLKFELENQKELIEIQAELAKKQYDSLLKQGFTEQQVLEIITKQPSWR